MYYRARIDANGLCIGGYSASNEPPAASDEIPVDGPVQPYMGRTWNGTEWSAPAAKPQILSATAFMDHCYAHLGGSATGMARFRAIIRAARALADDPTSPNDLVGAAVERYDAAKSGGTFAKAQVQSFSAILVGVNLMTQTEADNIVNNWPNE